MLTMRSQMYFAPFDCTSDAGAGLLTSAISASVFCSCRFRILRADSRFAIRRLIFLLSASDSAGESGSPV